MISNVWSGKFTRNKVLYLCLPLLVAIALLLGIELTRLQPIYSIAILGAIIIAIPIVLRQDALVVTLVIAIHLYIDWYWGLEFVAQLMELTLLLIFFFGRSPRYPWAEPRSFWLWFLFIALAIFPATHGISLIDTLNYYFNIIFGALTIFWIGTIIARDTANVRRIFKMLAIFSSLLAIHAIIQATTGTLLFATSRFDAYFASIGGYYDIANTSRAGSFFINPDSSGGFLSMALFIPLSLFVLSSSLQEKIFYLAQTFLIMVALLFTYSTGGWIAAAAGAFAFLIFIGSTRYRIQFSLFILTAVVILLVGFSAQVNIQIQHAMQPNEASLREGAWLTGLRVIRAFPLTGTGLGRYVYLIRAEPYRVLLQYRSLAHPHNSYIEIGALAGLPVLIVFLALLALAFWLAFRNWERADSQTRTLLAGGIATVVSLSANSMVTNAWTLIPLAAIGWLILGILSSPLLTKNLNHRLGDEKSKQLTSKPLSSHFPQASLKERIPGGSKKLALRPHKYNGDAQLSPTSNPVRTKTILCTNCHAILPSFVNFCSVCGAKLKTA